MPNVLYVYCLLIFEYVLTDIKQVLNINILCKQ